MFSTVVRQSVFVFAVLASYALLAAEPTQPTRCVSTSLWRCEQLAATATRSTSTAT